MCRIRRCDHDRTQCSRASSEINTCSTATSARRVYRTSSHEKKSDQHVVSTAQVHTKKWTITTLAKLFPRPSRETPDKLNMNQYVESCCWLDMLFLQKYTIDTSTNGSPVQYEHDRMRCSRSCTGIDTCSTSTLVHRVYRTNSHEQKRDQGSG